MPASAPSLADLVERHRPELLRYLVRLLGNETDAQDACQDALLRAYRARGRFVHGTNARAWLYRIATTSGLSYARSRRRRLARLVPAEMDAFPAVTQEGSELTVRVERAVRALPPRQRAALMLRQFHDLDYAAIAVAVGGTAAAARANVYQALKRLRAALGEDE